MKTLVSFAAAVALSLATSAAFADPPMPECVNNPACQGGGCSVGSRLAAGAPGGLGIITLAAAAMFVTRRRAR